MADGNERQGREADAGDRSAGTRRVLAQAAIFGAIAFGVVAGLMTEKDVRRALLGDDRDLPRATAPHELRSLVLARRDAALDSGDLVAAAATNAMLAQEATRRARAVHDAWMPRRDPQTKLFPEAPDEPEWNYRNTAADFFCFMLHASIYTDAPSTRRLRETLRAEAELAGPGELCQPVHWKTGKPVREGEAELLFASSEYAKDGLLSLYEAYGGELVSERMVEVVDAVLAHSRHESRFGPIPDERSEVNGEMLQVLSRLALVSDGEEYAEMAARIADAVTAQMLAVNNGLPAHTFDYGSNSSPRRGVKLRDHGNEIVGGLSEVYALAVSRGDEPRWAERADRWAEPIARMLELIFEHAINEDGLLVNVLDPEGMEQTDPEPSDNWGYVLSGALLFVQAAERHGNLERERLEALLARTDEMVEAVTSTNGLPWEGESHDGYADAIESALLVAAHRPESAPALLPWSDDQIGIMFGMQDPIGFASGHYLDGNFIRTALMYADMRSGGWVADPWDEGAAVGLAVGAGGRAALVVESSGGYEGTLRHGRPGHALTRALPWDWPRLNSWPRWMPPSRIETVVAAEGIDGPTPTIETLREGLDVSIPPGGRVVILLETDRTLPEG